MSAELRGTAPGLMPTAIARTIWTPRGGPLGPRLPQAEAGQIMALMAAWGTDPARSFPVGYQSRNVQATEAAGLAGYRVEPGEVLAAARAGLRRHLRH